MTLREKQLKIAYNKEYFTFYAGKSGKAQQGDKGVRNDPILIIMTVSSSPLLTVQSKFAGSTAGKLDGCCSLPGAVLLETDG